MMLAFNHIGMLDARARVTARLAKKRWPDARMRVRTVLPAIQLNILIWLSSS